MIYLDYAATDIYPRFHSFDYTKHDYFDYFNPNANYAKDEKDALLKAEENIKNAIGVNNGRIFYFRTCTDSVKWLVDTQKFRVYADEDTHDALYVFNKSYNQYTGNKVLIMCSYVNHITGAINNKKPVDCYNLLDCTQAIGKIPMDANLLNLYDCIVMSGHKIGCPELSFMWMSGRLCKYLGASNDIRNQWGLVHGSLPVSCVLALTKAVESVCSDVKLVQNKYANLMICLKEKLKHEGIEHKDIAGDCDSRSPSIIGLYLPEILAEPLQSYLAAKQIYVGVGGSACAERRDYRVLNAMGYTNEQADHVIRISFGKDTKTTDIYCLVERIKEFKKKYL